MPPHTLAHGLPGAWGWLAKQPHGGIPWRVCTMLPPTPIGGKRQQGPDRFTHGPCQMGDGSVNRNHQVEVRYHPLCQQNRPAYGPHRGGSPGGGWSICTAAGASLQTEERQVWEVRQRRQGCQGAGAIPIIFV